MLAMVLGKAQLTPQVGLDHGLILDRQREENGQRTILYRQATARGPRFIVTHNHLVTTVSSNTFVATWAFLHS